MKRKNLVIHYMRCWQGTPQTQYEKVSWQFGTSFERRGPHRRTKTQDVWRPTLMLEWHLQERCWYRKNGVYGEYYSITATAAVRLLNKYLKEVERIDRVGFSKPPDVEAVSE